MEYFFLGLGNPKSYKGTRHNIGKDFIEGLVEQSGSQWKKIGMYRIATILLGPHIVLCAVSDGNMNNTGEDLKDILLEVDPKRLVVFYDDLDFMPGIVRLAQGKNDGGHNGIKSIISVLKSKDFLRFRIGVGKKSPIQEYVLEKIPQDELEKITKRLQEVFPCVFKNLLEKNIENALNFCNTKGVSLVKNLKT